MTIQVGKHKSKARQKTKIKSGLYPNDGSLMSYYMQAIEPDNDDINKAFPGYHPKWIIRSQSEKPSGERFKYYRKELLRINQEQMAAYLRLPIKTIQDWENNELSVPFMVIETLRLLYKSAEFNLSNAKWAGWFISYDGALVCTDTKNVSFQPHELAYIREMYSRMNMYKSQYELMLAEIEPLKSEVAYLRQLLDENGVLTAVEELQTKIAELVEKVRPNKVVPIKSPTVDDQKEKAA